jgi:hypothetical protein
MVDASPEKECPISGEPDFDGAVLILFFPHNFGPVKNSSCSACRQFAQFSQSSSSPRINDPSLSALTISVVDSNFFSWQSSWAISSQNSGDIFFIHWQSTIQFWRQNF